MTERKKGGLFTSLRHRDFRVMQIGFAVSRTGDWLYVAALAVYVFDRTHSAGWVAAATFSRLGPWALMSPFAGVLADRFSRRAVMIAADLARAAFMLGLTILAALDGPALGALILAALTAMAGSPYLPAFSAMTPELVPEEDLGAANALTSTVDNLALLVGPALGGVLLLLGSPATAFGVNAFTFLASVAAVTAVREKRTAVADDADLSSFREQFVQGIRAVTTNADTALMIGVTVVATLIYGQESVLLVLVSKQLIHTGSSGVGFLYAAIGAGGLIAAQVSNRLVGGRNLGAALAAGVALTGLALVGVSFTHSAWVAYALLLLEGAGAIIIDVIAITMLQRTVHQTLLARVFSIFFSVVIAAVLVGAAVAPFTVRAFGLRGALIFAGAVPAAMLLLATRRLADLSRRAAERADEIEPTVALLAGLRLFEGTPRPSLERIATSLERHHVPPNTPVVREGEPADAFYVIQSGRAEVLLGGERVRELGAGDYFGEIGLLGHVPRTATVRTLEDSELLKIPAEQFFAAVNDAPALSSTVLVAAVGRLAQTHPGHRIAGISKEEVP